MYKRYKKKQSNRWWCSKRTKGDKTDKLTPLKDCIKLEKLESSVYDIKELDKKFLTDMDFYIKNQKNGLVPKYRMFGLYNIIKK